MTVMSSTHSRSHWRRSRARPVGRPSARRSCVRHASSLLAVAARYNGAMANFRRDPAMSKVHRVVVLATHGVYPFDLGIPQRVFGAADGRYEVLTCTTDGRPVRTNADFSVTVDHGPEILGTADTVIIPPFGTTDFSRETPVV